MDAIRAQLKNPLVSGIGGLVVGLIVGLFLAWVVWPVEYKDASPEYLQQGFQEDYLKMAAESFQVNKDVALAQRRFKDLGPKGEEILAAVEQQGDVRLEGPLNAFRAAIGSPAVAPGAEESAPLPGPTSAAETTEKKSSFPIFIIVIMCVVTLGLAAAALVYFMRYRSKPMTMTPAMQAQEAAREAEMTDYSATGEPPISQFMASYKIGDDLFDDSFSIDSPSGEFLGECGVGISETIGVGDPKKVTAFEVWLFDKNDIQTVTKVLMSAHAYEDDAILNRLSAKGEPVLAEPDSQIVLETATLRMTARIHDMSYGVGALPERSFFDSLILEIAVWQKA